MHTACTWPIIYISFTLRKEARRFSDEKYATQFSIQMGKNKTRNNYVVERVNESLFIYSFVYAGFVIIYQQFMCKIPEETKPNVKKL